MPAQTKRIGHCKSSFRALSSSPLMASGIPHAPISGTSGVCLMSNTWKDEQHPSFINFISSYLRGNSFRLNFVSIAPDFIFNCGGVSVAFVFATKCDGNFSLVFERVQKLKVQFAHLYVVITVPTEEQNEYFVDCLLKSELKLGKPPFIAVEDLEMGFEKIVKIALACGACKQQDVLSKLTVEMEQAVQSMDTFVRIVSSIPGIDSHDAHSLNQVIGSIEAIAKASKEYIVENTDISGEKADMIVRFFRDPKLYMAPKIQ